MKTGMFRFISVAILLVVFSFQKSMAQTKPVKNPPAGFQKPPDFQRSPAARQSESTLSYDLSAGAGTYNGSSYNEFNLGLNWMVADWLNWRNALFTRLSSASSDSISGLDSSLRLQGSMLSDSGTFGMSGFIGPGVRFATKDANAAFAEAGLMFKVGGLHLGGGVKSVNYFKTRQDSSGADLPKNDNQVFIILSGSGNL